MFGQYWVPQIPVTTEQAAADNFLFEKRRTFFEKPRFWDPQAMFTAEQAAAGTFCFEKDVCFPGSGRVTVLVNS